MRTSFLRSVLLIFFLALVTASCSKDDDNVSKRRSIAVQVSSYEAIEIVNSYIKDLHIDNYIVYFNPAIIYPETTIYTFEKILISASFNSWLFFLDKYPMANWTHPCSFFFIDVYSGKIMEKKWSCPPNDLDKWVIIKKCL